MGAATPGYEAIDDDDDSEHTAQPAWATPAHARGHAHVVAKAAASTNGANSSSREITAMVNPDP
jgi:hypothetical protein